MIFLTTQKSNELNIMTKMNVRISDKKLPMIRYMTIAHALNAKVNTHAVGWAASLRLYFSCIPPMAGSFEPTEAVVLSDSRCRSTFLAVYL